MMTVLSVLAAGPVAAKKKKEAPPQVSHDGLELRPNTEVALAYVKPGADFSGYERIMILDTYVAFKKNWAVEQNRTSVHKVRNSDIERMKKEVAELFREVFVGELSGDDGYPVVESADTDVLLLRPAIIDLDVTAPELKSVNRTYNFAASAGAATLYLELYDSVSGEILARVMDRKIADTAGGFMRWSNAVTNRAAAKQVLADWAGLLRQRLDEIHGGAKD
jgi:hypothetical protein